MRPRRSGPDSTGPHLIGAAGIGHLTLAVDGTVVADGATTVPDDPVEAMARPGEIRATAVLEAGREAEIRLEFRPAADGEGPLALRLGIVPAADEDAMLAEAEQAAGRADAAVVVVGSAAADRERGLRPGAPWRCPAGRTSWSGGWPRSTAGPWSW